ncbi:hypothetical protein [Winogradskyella aurantiaca]|uniref:hypothetical protein n=1 Tax=Winogradskyella aurantiaca TaxID=2219558 RepID=UPI0013005AF3|nr:hypothetical protein [Winogradskyella aurantiaca]
MVNYGREESVDSRGSIEMYTIHLKRIESGHIVKKNEQTDDQREEIKQKESKIISKQKKIDSCNEAIQKIENVTIPNKQEELNNLSNEIESLERTNPKDLIITEEKFKPWVFYVCLIAVLFLTIFIYYFYVNLGYVLFDIPSNLPPDLVFSCSPSVLNSITELKGDGGCSTSLSTGPLLLPILFLTIAVLIHIKLENILKAKSKKYLAAFGIFLLLSLVLILDTILAIKFEERLFNWEGKGGPFGEQFPVGLMEQLSYSYKEPAFLLILGLGFVGYIVWSLILHEMSKEWDKKDPEIIWRRKLKFLRQKKEELKEKIQELKEEKNNTIPDQIRSYNNEISEIRETIKLIKIGGVEMLRQALIEFTIGWNQFLTFNYPRKESDSKINEIKSSLNQFLESSSILSTTNKISESELAQAN